MCQSQDGGNEEPLVSGGGGPKGEPVSPLKSRRIPSRRGREATPENKTLEKRLEGKHYNVIVNATWCTYGGETLLLTLWVTERFLNL